MAYWVYVLYNQEADKIYIGQTNDLGRRLDQHQKGFFSGSFTSRFKGEWKIVHTEKFPTRTEAIIRERQLKSFRGRKFLREKYCGRSSTG